MAKDPLQHWQSSDTYLGFDFGDKKIGVAVGQLTTKTASSLKTLPSIQKQPNWQAITQLIEEWQPVGFVVGLSIQFDGSDNPISPRMRKFARQLHGRYLLPVFIEDETLSTFEAKQLLYDDVHLRAQRLWAVQDQLAAQLILQSWLNHH